MVAWVQIPKPNSITETAAREAPLKNLKTTGKTRGKNEPLFGNVLEPKKASTRVDFSPKLFLVNALLKITAQRILNFFVPGYEFPSLLVII